MKLTEKEQDLLHICSIISRKWFDRIVANIAHKVPGLPRLAQAAAVVLLLTETVYTAFENELAGKPGAVSWEEIYETFSVANFEELCDLWVVKYLNDNYDDSGTHEAKDSGTPETP